MSNESLRMKAYYYGFSFTSSDLVDRILSAVACAGKAFHHTESWSDEIETPYKPVFRGASPIDWIQNAAEDAAAEITTLTAERDALKGALKNLVEVICEHIVHNAECWQKDNNCPIHDKALSALKAANAALSKKQEP